MEKEQEAWKDIFLKKAEEEIKNKIKEIVIDVAEQTNHKLKFDYSSFVSDRVAINLGMFKGVRVEQYQEQLASILNDMSYEHNYNQSLLKIVEDVYSTNFLNLGMSFKVDYRTINFFNLKTEIENEKKIRFQSIFFLDVVKVVKDCWWIYFTQKSKNKHAIDNGIINNKKLMFLPN
jgi:hypothetical protein